MINYRLFGFPVTSSLTFPGDWAPAPAAADATTVRLGEIPPWPGTAPGGWRGVSDGRVLTVERSWLGEHRFLSGDQSQFHLSADQRVLTSPRGSERDTRWWRMLLDTVLFTVGLLRGTDAIHAGAVATPSGAVAILGESGAGKSTILGALLRQGCELVTDDILFLETTADQVLAHPGPPLMTLAGERAGGVGRRLDEVGDEVWATVPVVAGPVPLRRVVELGRRPGAPLSSDRTANPLAALMTSLLSFPAGRERELSRLSLASALATRVEIRTITADLNTSPRLIATLGLDGLAA